MLGAARHTSRPKFFMQFHLMANPQHAENIFVSKMP